MYIRAGEGTGELWMHTQGPTAGPSCPGGIAAGGNARHARLRRVP